MKKNNSLKNRITIKELIEQLKVFNEESELIFADDELSFYRTKRRDDNLVQIEFNESILIQDLNK